jgi:hypothetical protein
VFDVTRNRKTYLQAVAAMKIFIVVLEHLPSRDYLSRIVAKIFDEMEVSPVILRTERPKAYVLSMI